MYFSERPSFIRHKIYFISLKIKGLFLNNLFCVCYSVLLYPEKGNKLFDYGHMGSFTYYVITEGRGFLNDCASVILTQLLCVQLIKEGERGSKIDQKVIT